MPDFRKQAAEDHNIKLVLERRLRTKIDKLNAKAVRTYVISVARNGHIPNFYRYEDELRKILEVHDRLVASIFVDRINMMVRKAEGEEKELVPTRAYAHAHAHTRAHAHAHTHAHTRAYAQAHARARARDTIEEFAARTTTKIPVVVSRYTAAKTSSQVGAITDTTRKQAADALAKAQSIAVSNTVEKIEVASLSGSIFRTQLNGRTTGIVRLNTNVVAESTKLTQVELLSGEDPTLSGNGTNRSKIKKRWANMGDSIVRDGNNAKFNHLNAEQIVAADKPFTVSGEQMMFPGDASLGASIGNLINCRCSATYDPQKVANTRKKIKETGGKVPQLPKPTPPRAKAITAATDDVTYEEIFAHQGNITKEFQEQLEIAWKQLPIEIRQLARDAGLKINVGETLKHAEKAIRQHLTKTQMNGYLGFFVPGSDAIIIGEKVMFRGGGLGLHTDAGRTLIHEIGHFVDHAFFKMGIGGSDTMVFADSWKMAMAGVNAAADKKHIFESLGYFIKQKQYVRSLSESFAESYAGAYAKSTGTANFYARSPLFDKHMKQTIAEVKRQTNKYIKEKAAGSGRRFLLMMGK